MKRYFLPILVLMVLLVACSSEPSNNTGTTTAADTTATTPDEATTPSSHNCSLGTALEGNSFWSRDLQKLIVIRADSSTYDANLGESHRVLTVIDTRSCEQIWQQTLPVNVSPDFPYYLADLLYNSASKLVAIRGFSDLYLYDLANNELLPKLNPKFLTARDAVDAQTGMIRRLELWETYLMGYSQDYGAFVFDLQDASQVKSVLPFAEYKMESEEYNSLFLLPSSAGGQQALIPHYDIEKDEFAVNPLFPAPVAVSTNIPKSARNNRFLVMRAEGNNQKAYAIDLQKMTTVALPEAQQQQTTQAILEWLRKNQR